MGKVGYKIVFLRQENGVYFLYKTKTTKKIDDDLIEQKGDKVFKLSVASPAYYTFSLFGKGTFVYFVDWDTGEEISTHVNESINPHELDGILDVRCMKTIMKTLQSTESKADKIMWFIFGLVSGISAILIILNVIEAAGENGGGGIIVG